MSYCNFDLVTWRENGLQRRRCSVCKFETPKIPDLGQLVYRYCDGQEQPRLKAGTALKALLAEVDVIDNGSCGCNQKAAEMDLWGDGVREHRAEIIAWLQAAAAERGWVEKISVGAKLLACSWFNPLDPFGSLCDEAVRRAEAALVHVAQVDDLAAGLVDANGQQSVGERLVSDGITDEVAVSIDHANGDR